jgi:hypothetical protein
LQCQEQKTDQQAKEGCAGDRSRAWPEAHIEDTSHSAAHGRE